MSITVDRQRVNDLRNAAQAKAEEFFEQLYAEIDFESCQLPALAVLSVSAAVQTGHNKIAAKYVDAACPSKWRDKANAENNS